MESIMRNRELTETRMMQVSWFFLAYNISYVLDLLMLSHTVSYHEIMRLLSSGILF